MKRTLRIISLFIALLMALSFAACSGEAENRMEMEDIDGIFNQEPSNSGGVFNGSSSIGSGDHNGASSPNLGTMADAEAEKPEDSPDEEYPDLDHKGDPDYDGYGDITAPSYDGAETDAPFTEPDLTYAPAEENTEAMEENTEAMEEGTNASLEEATEAAIPDDETVFFENDQTETAAEGVMSDLITTPFTRTEQSNFSTFSADVDTASYTYFRKLASSGYYDWNALRRSGSQFRTEEFINYFRYDVNTPKEGELFGAYTEIAPCPWNKRSMLLRITLEAEKAEKSAGNNLVFLIDVSGSMASDDKLPLLKKAFSYLVGNLTPADTISIVTYSGREAVVLEGCRGGNTAEIMNAINSLRASGSTNGAAGLSMAYAIAERYMIEGGNNRIIMASDGDLNVGISTQGQLKTFIEEKREQGVYLSVLGFGSGNYRDEKMETLADNGNGVYYYIDGESEAEKVFGTDLAGTLYTVANDVKLQIEFNKDWIEEYRMIGYENRALEKEDFENDKKDAGEVGAGHQVTVVYEIKLKAQPTSIIENRMMTLRVRYKNSGETLSRLNEYDIRASDIKTEPSDETRFIACVIEIAELLGNRDYDGNITLNSVLSELEELELEDQYMAEFRDVIRRLAK